MNNFFDINYNIYYQKVNNKYDDKTHFILILKKYNY